MPGLVPRAVQPGGLLEVLQRASNGGACHMVLVHLSAPIPQLQITPDKNQRINEVGLTNKTETM